ncbi:crooked neck [Thecamonas trahens ATCC 50062]|uniref:Crooked neck n=1 Tax=Thecamonas trahens ATCC 50062 TaxID=461836 RepID=A0A0L0D4K6_THETB|nr:crooked neck [Thecamonas trahens ATCC 50062]KNC47292.1 crooked neck [Thecamonas trahens ATCC 50062]|eukprot:XP_013759633.1 crooked neck [Thecamonas trahens ATCC 50062]
MSTPTQNKAAGSALDVLAQLQPTHLRKAGSSEVRNRAAAQVQITVEQILQEALDQQGQAEVRKPTDVFADKAEVEMYMAEKRSKFEEYIGFRRKRASNYIRYAAWEESVGEFERARSIFERGVAANYRDATLWTKYADMEMRAGHINSARNVLVRAVTHLPRHDAFWFKFAAMEEMVGNIAGARTVYAKWMEWNPGKQAWHTYINFEKRYEEWDRVRAIYADYVIRLEAARDHAGAATAWLKAARFEETLGEVARARDVYERAMAALEASGALGDAAVARKLFVAFAKFEERVKEYERARVIYKYALDTVPASAAGGLEDAFLAFEKRHGTKGGIESVLITQQREAYDAALAEDPTDYDLWFEYVRVEEGHGDPAAVREVYERAIGAKPDELLKTRPQGLTLAQTNVLESYGYLFINYALYEELTAGDVARAGVIYELALGLFKPGLALVERLYMLAAGVYVRAKDLGRARKILGHGIGAAPSHALFDYYIQLEYDLLNFDAARSLYNKYLEFEPEAVEAWIKYASFEASLLEPERARGLYELAIEQPLLDMPEVLWKAYIDFEIAEDEQAKAIQLFERLLTRTKHVKVFVTYAKYLASLGAISDARAVYTRAVDHTRVHNLPDQRLTALKAWHALELEHGSQAEAKAVTDQMPQRVKKRRMVRDAEGNELGWEEYYDYIWADTVDRSQANLKFLEKARQWAMQNAAQAQSQHASPAAGGGAAVGGVAGGGAAAGGAPGVAEPAPSAPLGPSA